jgi:hypothetical protein
MGYISIRFEQIVMHCFYTSFGVVMVGSMKIMDFLDIAPLSLADRYIQRGTSVSNFSII